MYEWFGIVLVLVIAEIVTTNMVFASFAIGALSAAIIATFTDSVLAQVFGFGIMSVLSLTAVRPTVLKYLYRKSGTHISGLNRLIGHACVASSVIDSKTGEIYINGETWTARTNGSPILANTKVIIKSLNGAIAIVEPQTKD